MAAENESHVYLHGHHQSVTQDHSRRTAQDSAAFLLSYIQPGFTILDVGCGTGTITIDLATLAFQGIVDGVDTTEIVLGQARKLAESRDVKNVRFSVADAGRLPFQDGHFDIVYCHQVLQHVQDPVNILREMRRVAKPGGLVAAREADYRSFAWYPEPVGLQKWAVLYQKAARASGGEPNAGRHLHKWAREAGFEPKKIEASWDSWYYTGNRAVQFSQAWKERTLHSFYAEVAKKHDLASDAELEEIAEAWDLWSNDQDAFIALPSGQILCRKDT
ncbi:hypothetical protein MMC10_008559 [Thelotrema lepadinum]|nr:hypothetical protein [Thelotrema lepadinum]